MGHLVNPISNRLGTNTYWTATWATTSRFNYSLLFKKDFLLFYYFDLVFTKIFYNMRLNHVLCWYKFYRINDKIYINILYYEPFFFEHNKANFITWPKHLEWSSIKIETERSENTIKKIKYLLNNLLNILLPNLFWYVLSNNLTFDLKKINNVKENIIFNIYSVNVHNIQVSAVSSYIAKKLLQKYSLTSILNPILRDFELKVKENALVGYKILCAGRFTRKQIASNNWWKGGSLNTNTVSNVIKYSLAKVRLKYGICGIKVWINYGHNFKHNKSRPIITPIFPNYIPFKYSYNAKKGLIKISINNWFFSYFRAFFKKENFFKSYQNFLSFKMKLIIYNFLKYFFPYKENFLYKLDITKRNFGKNFYIKINPENMTIINTSKYFDYQERTQ